MLVDAVSAGLRAVSFIAIFQATGTAIFLAVLAGPLRHESRAALRHTQFRACCIALIFALAHYLVEAGRMGGSLSAIADPSLQKMALQSPAATAFFLRVVGLLLVGLSAFVQHRYSALTALPGAMLTLVAFTQTGHTSLDDAPQILPFLLCIHLVVVAYWFGALAALRRISLDEPPGVTAAIVGRFSAIAVWVVPLVFVAGALLAAILLGSFGALGTPYGLAILAKALLFAGLMLMAAGNKWLYGPKLGRGEPAALRAFRRMVAAEYIVICATLTLTAVLTTYLSPD